MQMKGLVPPYICGVPVKMNSECFVSRQALRVNTFLFNRFTPCANNKQTHLLLGNVASDNVNDNSLPTVGLILL